MKPYMKGALFALMALGAAAQAANTAAPALTMPQAPQEKIYFDMNLASVSFAWMKDLDNGLTVDDLMGGTLSLGQSFGETDRYYHTWHARAGYLYGSDRGNSQTPTSYLVSLPSGGSSLFDGVVDTNYRIEQTVISVSIGYAFHYKWTEKLNTYVGAQVGFLYSQTNKKTESTGRILGPNGQSLGLADATPSARTHTRFVPTLGLELGAIYKFNKRVSWDIGVNFDATLRPLYKEDTSNNQTIVSKEHTYTMTLHTGVLFTF